MVLRYVFLLLGSVLILLLGIAHLLWTRPIVHGFGSVSEEKKRIVRMGWITIGFTLCFIGFLIVLVTSFAGPQNLLSALVYRASAWMLVVMAALTFVTGAKTSIKWIKVYPLINSISAILFFLGSAR